MNIFFHKVVLPTFSLEQLGKQDGLILTATFESEKFLVLGAVVSDSR